MSKIAEQVVAQTIVDLLNPQTEMDKNELYNEVLDHVKKTGGDAKSFFGGNGGGYNEYLRFINKYDKDAYLKALKKRGVI